MKKTLLFSLALIFTCIFTTNAQQLSIQTGHSAIIYDLEYSPDGSLLASCGADNKIILWDLLSGKQMNILSGHQKAVNAISIHPTKKIIASVSDDGTLKIWKYPTGKLLKTLRFFDSPVKSVAFSPNGKSLACGADFIYLINLKDYDYQIISKANKKGYNAIAYSPNGEKLAFGGKKSKTYIYNLEKEKIIKSFRAKSNALIFGENSKLLYSAGQNGKIKRGRTGLSLRKKFNIPANYSWNSFYSIVLTEDYFAAANRDNLIYIYSRSSGKRKEILKYHDGDVRALAVSPSGKYMASAGKDQKIIIWNMEKFTIDKKLEGGAGRVNAISFSENGKLMFIGYHDGSFRIWNLARKGRILYGKVPAPSFIEKLQRNEYSIENTSEFINSKQILIKTSLNKRHRRTDEFLSKREDMIIWSLGREDKMALVKNKKNTDYSSFALKNNEEVLAFQYKSTHSQKFSLLDARRIKDREEVFSTYIRNADLSSFSTEKKKFKFKKFKNRKAYSTKGDLFFKTVSANGEVLLTLKKEGKKETLCTLLSSDDFTDVGIVSLSQSVDKAKLSKNAKYFCLSNSNRSKIYLYKAGSMEMLAEFSGQAPITFSPNEKQLAYTDDDKNLHLFDISTKKEIFVQATKHQSSISDIKFNTPYNYIATASHDGLIRFWNLDTGKNLLSLAAFGQSEFVYVNADNYYYATKGAMPYISFLMNDKLYAFDQFDMRYNRPDLVLSKLAYSDSTEIAAYYRAYKKRIKKMGFSEEQFTGQINIPTATISNRDEFGISTDENKILLKIKAKDKTTNLDRINVWVNDVPLFGINGYSLKGKKSKTYKGEFEVFLSSGKNKIQVSTVNQLGVESLKETFSVNYLNKKPQANLYLITVGVSKYENSDYDLNYAAKDANDIAELFKKQKKSFDNIHVISILDKEATKTNILKIKSQLEGTKPDDVVMFFFAGHGTLDADMNYYLATTEVDMFDLEETALRYDLLEDLMDSIPARKKVVFIDACHSGEVDKDEDFSETGESTNENQMLRDIETNEALQVRNISTQNSFELMKLMFADLRKGTGTTVISSAGGGEYAYENDKNKNGIFTYIMISGIKSGKADANNDGEIMISELRDYVMKNVSILTKGHQNPTSRRENLEFDFRVW